MSHFADPGVFPLQEYPQGIFDFRSAIHPQQAESAFTTPTPSYQQPKQKITEEQHLQLDLSRASSLTPPTSYPGSKPCSEEIITEIVNRVHTNSEIRCQEDFPTSQTPVLPCVTKNRRRKNKTNQEKRLLAGRVSKDSGRDEARRTRNRVSARNSRKRKRGRSTQSTVYRNQS
jgi:hypothetical protein